MWPAYVWPQNGQESRESCRAAERFKFISPRKNLPFKEQMLPPLYQNHLFVFIALVLSRCQSASPNLIVMQHGRSFVGNCKWCCLLHIAYCLLPIVMQHGRSFGEMASNAAAKMTSKTAEQHRLCTQKRSRSLRSKPDLLLLQNYYFDVVQFLAWPRQHLLIAIKSDIKHSWTRIMLCQDTDGPSFNK